ncbi:MAG: VOC family protein [Pseudomonadota bacterium]
MTYRAPDGTRIGHVHLRVSDLDRSIAFYRDVLGLELQAKLGRNAAFLGAGGYHHHIGLNTWDSFGGPPAQKNHAGLYHVAFLFQTRPELARALKRVLEAGVTLTGAADHGVSEAVYFDDPDGNGIEIYCDRDRADWPTDAVGNPTFVNAHLDLETLLREADDQSSAVDA